MEINLLHGDDLVNLNNTSGLDFNMKDYHLEQQSNYHQGLVITFHQNFLMNILVNKKSTKEIAVSNGADEKIFY